MNPLETLKLGVVFHEMAGGGAPCMLFLPAKCGARPNLPALHFKDHEDLT